MHGADPVPGLRDLDPAVLHHLGDGGKRNPLRATVHVRDLVHVKPAQRCHGQHLAFVRRSRQQPGRINSTPRSRRQRTTRGTGLRRHPWREHRAGQQQCLGLPHTADR
jgi:hypothetical protein